MTTILATSMIFGLAAGKDPLRVKPFNGAPIVESVNGAPIVEIDSRKIEIPIKYDPSKKNEIKELHLYVSQDFGKKWTKASSILSGAEYFSYEFPNEGTYSFGMMIASKDGTTMPDDLKSLSPAYHVRFVQRSYKLPIPDGLQIDSVRQTIRGLVTSASDEVRQQTIKSINAAEKKLLKYAVEELQKENRELKQKIEKLEKSR
jgi:hypothetical protein